jgi:hypothetical protein
MAATEHSPLDVERAQKIWKEYAAAHDVSDMTGKAAGIDPVSGQVWLGDSASDIYCRLKSEGRAVPLFFVRVGHPTYWRKGVRR